MRKAIVLGIGILIGIALGYASRGVVAVAILNEREPYLVSAYLQYIGESAAFCTNRGLQEEKASLLSYGGLLAKGFESHPNDVARFYYALAEARLYTVESGLNDRPAAIRHMQNAQEQLSKLGWTDVTPEHILAIVARVYQQPEPSSSKEQSASACSEQSRPALLTSQAISE